MLVPAEVTEESPIEAAVAEVLKDLSPSVRYMPHEIRPDWTGERTIYFRVVLADEATRGEGRWKIIDQVDRRISDRLIPARHVPSVSYRSESEQAQVNDPAWRPPA